MTIAAAMGVPISCLMGKFCNGELAGGEGPDAVFFL